jgi:hypothetical protein
MDNIEIKNHNFNNVFLIFGPSRSDNYKKALEILGELDEVKTVKNERGETRYHRVKVLIKNISKYHQLMNCICKLQSSKIIINDNEYNLNHYKNAFDCFLNGLKHNNFPKYCSGEYKEPYFDEEVYSNPFGCMFLPNSNRVEGWYTYGHLNEKNIFFIEKSLLKEKIDSYFSLCPIYDKNYALNKLNVLPNLIDTRNDSLWEIGEIISPYDNKQIGAIPIEVIKSGLGNASYLNPDALQRSLDYLNKKIEEEQKLANYAFRKPRKLYFYGSCFPNSCVKCYDALHGKIFEGNDLLEKWRNKKVIPIPVLGCKSELCRCHFMPLITSIDYFDINGDLKNLDKHNTESVKEYNEFVSKNPHLYQEPKSFLPELTEWQKAVLKDIRFKVLDNRKTFDAKTLGKEYFIDQGREWLNATKKILEPWTSSPNESDKIIKEITNEYSEKVLEEKFFYKGIESYIILLKEHNYANEKSLSTLEIWGFEVQTMESGELMFRISDNFDELNKFERLSKFNPRTGKWNNI